MHTKQEQAMVKPSSPNTSRTSLIFLCLCTHASPPTCHHFASSILAVRISCHVITVFVFRKPLLTIIMLPKCKSSDAGTASKPKRIHDILSISEKVKILDMIEIEKKMCAEIARLYGKNESSIREVKNKEKFHAQHHNAYTITPLHLLTVGIVLSSYHRHHHHHHQ